MQTTLMKPIASTIYGAELQTAQLTGIPYSVRENTTLNQKFDILKGVSHASNEYPRMRYIAIGNGGHRAKIGNNGIEIGEILQHTPTHAALFNHIPFVAREPNNDLTPQEREKFALRRIETHNGKRFIVYYLRRLSVDALRTNLVYETVVDDGVNRKVKATTYTPTEEMLNPTPEVLEAANVNTLDGDYVRCEAIVPFQMTRWDLNELKNAANIIYGDERYAIITEMALVSAVDRVSEATNSGSSNFNYKEVVSAQCCAFIATDFRAYYHNVDVSLDINVGASEPMFKLVAP